MAVFSPLYTLLLWLTGVSWTVSLASECARQQGVFGDILEGYALVDHVITSLYSPSLLSCGHRCVLTAGCASINYGKEAEHQATRNICQLNSETRTTKPLSLRVKSEYFYVDSKVKFCSDGKECNMKCSASCSCECKQGFVGFYCQTWKGGDGSSSDSPGQSCKQIRAHDHSRGNKKYWIDPLGKGNPFEVFCDMTVDGGGWTTIKEVTLRTSSPSKSKTDAEDYRLISRLSENQVLTGNSLVQLRKDMGFDQLRFYCYKKFVNRTFHVMTKNNAMGFAVVKYYIEEPATQPQACESFTRLPNDNSILAQNCLHWGFKDPHAEINKWGHYRYRGPFRIYHHTAFWKGRYYFGFRPDYGYWCDDNKGAALSVGDKFGIYVR